MNAGTRRGLVVDGRAPLTFAEVTGSRPTKRVTGSPRTVPLTTPGERFTATVYGTRALAYNTPIASRLPRGRPGFLVEALEAACTYYEDLLNGSKPFKAAQDRRGPSRAAASAGSTSPGAIIVVGRGRLTFPEATSSRPTMNPSLKPTTYSLPGAVVERAAATQRCVLGLAQGTRIANIAPWSLPVFVAQAVEPACTYYEDLLNDSKPFSALRSSQP